MIIKEIEITSDMGLKLLMEEDLFVVKIYIKDGSIVSFKISRCVELKGLCQVHTNNSIDKTKDLAPMEYLEQVLVC